MCYINITGLAIAIDGRQKDSAPQFSPPQCCNPLKIPTHSLLLKKAHGKNFKKILRKHMGKLRAEQEHF